MNEETKAVAVSDEQKLSKQLESRGVNPDTWNTLKNSVFPGALSSSILMAIDYCKARKLDVLKKPCHIVPMSVKDAKTGDHNFRDVVLPGIYEYRTTAQRTGLYLGHSKPEYGPEVESEGLSAPQWCEMTFLRWNVLSARTVEFPIRVYFREVVGLDKNGKVNARWSKAPVQMLTKCTEAAGLREAFPEELGGEMTVDEIIGQTFEHEAGKSEGSRTEGAKDRLRKQLGEVVHDKVPTGQVDNTPAQQTARQGAAAKAEQKVSYKFDVAAALHLLRKQPDVAALKVSYREIMDDFEMSSRELPIDVEAVYRDLKESFEEKEGK